MNDNVASGADTLVSQKQTAPFPTFVELGGPEVVSTTLLHAPHGLALFSGRTFSGKTTAIAALADELQRAGRNVLAVRAPHAESVPNVEELAVDSFRPSLIQDLLIGDKQDVVIVDEIRSSDAAFFVANLAQAGILVLASIHALDPWKALSHFLFRCESKKNKVVADSLLFSCGLKIVQDLENPEKTQDSTTARAVLTTERLFSSFNTIRMPVSFADPLGEWEVVQVPSRFNPGKFLFADILFPNKELREFILSYDGGVVEG